MSKENRVEEVIELLEVIGKQKQLIEQQSKTIDQQNKVIEHLIEEREVEGYSVVKEEPNNDIEGTEEEDTSLWEVFQRYK